MENYSDIMNQLMILVNNILDDAIKINKKKVTE